MSTIWKFLMRQWFQMRGNAKWDAVVRILQWIRQRGWPVLTATLASFWVWFKHAPAWEVDCLFGAIVIFGYLAIGVIELLNHKIKPSALSSDLEIEPIEAQKTDGIWWKAVGRYILPKLKEYYEKLQTRKIEIERMPPLEYFGKYKDRFHANYKFDVQTQGLSASPGSRA
jgi:hypothetical protein